MSSVVSWNVRLNVRDGRSDDLGVLMKETVESTQARGILDRFRAVYLGTLGGFSR